MLREAGGRRSADCGHATLLPLAGINLAKTSTTDADYVTDIGRMLVSNAARMAPEWPSQPPPAHHASRIASHTLVPLAIASADHLFGRPRPVPGASRVEGELGAVCAATTVRHAQPLEARARVSRVVRG